MIDAAAPAREQRLPPAMRGGPSGSSGNNPADPLGLLRAFDPLGGHAALMECLDPADAWRLLQVSSDCHRMVLEYSKAWRLSAYASPPFPNVCVRSLRRFLRSARGVERISMRLSGSQHGDEANSGVLQDLAASAPRLRCLELRGMSLPVMNAALALLKAGAWPLLEEVELQCIYPLPFVHNEPQLLLYPEALEARRKLGLPPLRRVEGLTELHGPMARRIWEACPSSRVTAIEGAGGEQVRALGRYMRAHPEGFPALKQLVLWGPADNYRPSDEEQLQDLDPGPCLGGAWRALGAGLAPAVETLEVNRFSAKMGSLAPLGEAIGQGMLPQLKDLLVDADCSGTVGFAGLMEGLRTAPEGVKLRRLRLPRVNLGTADTQELINALRAADGALSELEELELETTSGLSEGPVAESLLGAPCARTLRSMTLQSPQTPAAVARALLAALGEGVFPRCEALTLMGNWLTRSMVEALVAALKRRAEQGAPLKLRELTLRAGYFFGPALMTDLTPVFEAGALPCLQRLMVQGWDRVPREEGDQSEELQPLNPRARRGWTPQQWEEWERAQWEWKEREEQRAREWEAQAGPGFIAEWRALGAAVPLQYLEIIGWIPKSWEQRLLAAAADRAFLPRLLRLRWPAHQEEVDEALDARWRGDRGA